MPQAYKISTLLYAFNARGEVLLMHRAQEPNLGLWSPCGGKLEMASGESPYQCAIREAQEELHLTLTVQDLRLAGIISETGHTGQAHWLMFLFEIKTILNNLPPPHREGQFRFIPRHELQTLPLPQTDREQIWPLFWKHRGAYFAAHCQTHPSGANTWTIEETTRPREPVPADPA